MKTINYGKTNDACVYAVLDNFKGLTALDSSDLDFVAPDYKINFDAGVYVVADVNQYICNQVANDIKRGENIEKS